MLIKASASANPLEDGGREGSLPRVTSKAGVGGGLAGEQPRFRSCHLGGVGEGAAGIHSLCLLRECRSSRVFMCGRCVQFLPINSSFH